MRGRMIHEKSGALHFSPYDRDPNKCINSIGRGALNTVVIEAAQRYPNVRVKFNHHCSDVDLAAPAAQFVDMETDQPVEARAEAIIGVDGAFSSVRAPCSVSTVSNTARAIWPTVIRSLRSRLRPTVPGRWRKTPFTSGRARVS